MNPLYHHLIKHVKKLDEPNLEEKDHQSDHEEPKINLLVGELVPFFVPIQILTLSWVRFLGFENAAIGQHEHTYNHV